MEIKVGETLEDGKLKFQVDKSKRVEFSDLFSSGQSAEWDMDKGDDGVRNDCVESTSHLGGLFAFL